MASLDSQRQFVGIASDPPTPEVRALQGLKIDDYGTGGHAWGPSLSAAGGPRGQTDASAGLRGCLGVFPGVPGVAPPGGAGLRTESSSRSRRFVEVAISRPSSSVVWLATSACTVMMRVNSSTWSCSLVTRSSTSARGTVTRPSNLLDKLDFAWLQPRRPMDVTVNRLLRCARLGGELTGSSPGEGMRPACTELPCLLREPFLARVLGMKVAPKPTAPLLEAALSGGRELPLRVVSAKVSLRNRFIAIWQSRELIIFLVRKELKVRYKNSVLGFLWSFLNPALVLLVYYVVFKYFLENHIDLFAIYLFAGLLPWNLFNNSLLSSAGVLVAQAGIVKKVSFPRGDPRSRPGGTSICYFFFQACIMVCFLVGFGVMPIGSSCPSSCSRSPVTSCSPRRSPSSSRLSRFISVTSSISSRSCSWPGFSAPHRVHVHNGRHQVAPARRPSGSIS